MTKEAIIAYAIGLALCLVLDIWCDSRGYVTLWLLGGCVLGMSLSYDLKKYRDKEEARKNRLKHQNNGGSRYH